MVQCSGAANAPGDFPQGSSAGPLRGSAISGGLAPLRGRGKAPHPLAFCRISSLRLVLPVVGDVSLAPPQMIRLYVGDRATYICCTDDPKSLTMTSRRNDDGA